MAEIRALCAGCRKPLFGSVLASTCNHVFHRDCLSKGTECTRCQQPLEVDKALALFGLAFEEVDDVVSISVMSAMNELRPQGVCSVEDSSDDEPVLAPSADEVSLNRSSSDLTSAQEPEEPAAPASEHDKLEPEVEEASAPSAMPRAFAQPGGQETNATAVTVLDLEDEDAAAGQTSTASDNTPVSASTNEQDMQDFSADASEGIASDEAQPSVLSSADPSPDVINQVAHVCLLRQKQRHRRKQLDIEEGRQSEARRYLQTQRDRLRAQERLVEKHDRECNQIAQEITQRAEKHDQMQQELNAVRQRDAVLEYWEILRSNNPQEALEYLKRTVSMVANPWKILTQVARLRDYHRQRLNSSAKEDSQASRRESKARRDLSELQKTVTKLKDKVHQQKFSQVASSKLHPKVRDSDTLQTQNASSQNELPVPKRPRI